LDWRKETSASSAEGSKSKPRWANRNNPRFNQYIKPASAFAEFLRGADADQLFSDTGNASMFVRSQTISGNGGHDNHGRGKKVSDPKMKEIGGLSRCEQLRCHKVLRIRKRCADHR
jgi:hypothetical protein